MRYFVVRHGETVWNVEGRFQGQMDTELNELGLQQADSAAGSLRGHGFEAVFTSPLARARVTADKIAAAAGCQHVIEDQRLLEINHGDWEGLLATEINERWPELFRLWHQHPEQVRMPGAHGETLAEVQQRAADCADEIAGQYSGDVLLASHDAVIKVLLCHWLGAPLASFWRFQVPNCGITIVELSAGKEPRMTLMGYTAHTSFTRSRPEQKGL